MGGWQWREEEEEGVCEDATRVRAEPRNDMWAVGKGREGEREGKGRFPNRPYGNAGRGRMGSRPRLHGAGSTRE